MGTDHEVLLATTVLRKLKAATRTMGGGINNTKGLHSRHGKDVNASLLAATEKHVRIEAARRETVDSKHTKKR